MDDEATAARPTCPTCAKSFFRKAHLLRHIQQHTGDRPYRCQFCSKTFKRSDVLRDHFSRCELRGSLPIPRQEDRGRKRHACDSCARLKVRCDTEIPCQKCKDFGRQCFRRRARVLITRPRSGQQISGAEGSEDAQVDEDNGAGSNLDLDQNDVYTSNASMSLAEVVKRSADNFDEEDVKSSVNDPPKIYLQEVSSDAGEITARESDIQGRSNTRRETSSDDTSDETSNRPVKHISKNRDKSSKSISGNAAVGTIKDSIATSTNSQEAQGMDRSSIGFLLNCPSDTEFHHRFPESKGDSSSSTASRSALTDYSDADTDESPLTKRNQELSIGCASHDPETTLGLIFDGIHSSTFESGDWDLENFDLSQALLTTIIGPAFATYEQLEVRAASLREKLRHAAEHIAAPNLPRAEVLDAIQLINGFAIDSFTKLYFRHWHKHGPVIHQPTFNPCEASSVLLMSVISLGGMYAKDEEDVAKLKLLLDLFEYSVFATPPFTDQYQDMSHPFVFDDGPGWRQRRLEEVQAGHLMIVQQHWTGDFTARKRVRRQLFSKLANAARRLRPVAMYNVSPLEIKNDETYHEWIQQEGFCRTINMLMMLDNAFVLFNNTISRFEWSELGDLEFPCEYPYWESGSYDTAVASTSLPIAKPKVAEAFRLLFAPEMNKHARGKIDGKKLNALDLQILIHFLYTHVWRQTFGSAALEVPSIVVQSFVDPLYLAIRNWKILWDEMRAAISKEEWDKMGFQRAAEFYWSLTKQILHAFMTKKVHKDSLPIDVDCDETGAVLKKLLA